MSKPINWPITEKRQQEIAFTDKLYAADSRLVVKKGSDITPDLFGNRQRGHNRIDFLRF
jgi:ABC-type amino acid transport substrate-binding protein